jgi:hypothetical protein
MNAFDLQADDRLVIGARPVAPPVTDYVRSPPVRAALQPNAALRVGVGTKATV